MRVEKIGVVQARGKRIADIARHYLMLADGISCNRKLMSWFENEFLDAPVQTSATYSSFSEGRRFRGPSRIGRVACRTCEDAENFSIEREL